MDMMTGYILLLPALWTAAALLVDSVAGTNGRPFKGWGWVLVSLVFSPFFALLCLTALGKKGQYALYSRLCPVPRAG